MRDEGGDAEILQRYLYGCSWRSGNYLLDRAPGEHENEDDERAEMESWHIDL